MIQSWPTGTKDDPNEWFGFYNIFDQYNSAIPPSVLTSNNIHYAIEIDVSDSTDIADEIQIGLFNDALLQGGSGGSVFRWVTDRPDYDGSAVVPTGELTTANAIKWGEGMISATNNLGTPNRLININVAGNYGSLSGFTFSLDNVEIEGGNFDGELFFDILDDNAIFLLNRKIRFYIVINDEFFNVWSGIVAKVAHNETRFDIICEDDFKNIHKVIPPQIANETLFPKIIEKSIGKPIPVSLGQINHARLLNVQTIGESLDIALDSDRVNRKIGLIREIIENVDSNGNPIDTTLKIIIGIGTTTTDQFKGKFLRIVIDGGGENFFEITESGVTTFDTPSVQNVFQVKINSVLEADDFTVFDPSLAFLDRPQNSWIEIFDFESVYVVSDGEITDFPNSEKGQSAIIEFFDKDQEIFLDVSEAGESESETDISSTGFPGLIAFTNAQANNGNFIKEFVIKPKSVAVQLIAFQSGVSIFSNDFPAIGVDIPNAIDRDLSTFNTIVFRKAAGTFASLRDAQIAFFVKMPDDLDVTGFENFFLIADYDITATLDGDAFSRGALSFNFRSLFNIPIGPNVEADFSFGKLFAGVPLPFRLINPIYYPGGTGLNGSLFSSIKPKIELNSFYNSDQVFRAYPKIFMSFDVNNFSIVTTTEDLTFKLLQIAFVGTKAISISDDNIFVKIVGEKIDGNITSNVNRIFEAILKTYDGLTASDLDLSDIESRKSWTAGRQLIERKSSFIYLKELAQQSFCGLFPSRIGKRKLSAFREFTTPIIEFAHNNGNILENSISKFELSPINEVYNEFDIKYEQNIANKRFDKSIFIKRVDESPFPDQFQSTGTDVTDATFTIITITVPITGNSIAVITWGVTPAGFVSGNAISLDDSAGIGVIEFARIVEVTATTVSFSFVNNSGFTDGQTTATGTIHQHGTSVPEWTTFAGGFSNYNRGLDLWTVCRNSFLQTLVVRELPPAFSHCSWYIDEANFDGDPGDQSTPHKYLAECVEWTTRQKEIVEFSIPLNPANVVLELLEFVTFRDQKFTANELRNGYITKIKPDPKADLIILELTLIPADIESITDCLIVGTGLNVDTIVGTGTEADTIVGTGTC